MPELDDLILKHTLKNAVQYGKANPKAVLGKVLGENPELRTKAREVMDKVNETVEKINSWSENQKLNKIRRVWPDAFVREDEQPVEKLRPLEGAEQGKVVVRIAPNPNGPPTLGSARGIVINAEYAKKYGGIFIMRFDDTDPETKAPLKEAYDWYVEDAEWLGCKPDRVVTVSEKIQIYYEYAEKLIKDGHCYICECSAEAFKALKDKGKECPHRNKAPEQNMREWKKMLDGGYKEGEAVLRVKTDMKHPDPAIRDWVAFRILEGAHPRVGKKHRVWPMLDFEGAIEDKLQGVTHIIRGKELTDSTRRQTYLYQYLGWNYPVTNYWGRVAMEEFGKISTSAIRKGIEAGEYTGWDDPRLPTIRSLKRRGFQPETIKEFWIDLGLTEKDISASMKNLEAFNKKHIEQGNRYYFVADPVEITVKGIPPTRISLKRHPDQPSRGVKRYEFEGEQRFLVPAKDVSDSFRLKDAFNVQKKSGEYVYAGRELTENKKVQWVLPDAMDVKVVMPDATILNGKGEKYLEETKLGDVVQFERFGFVRVDAKEPFTVYYTQP